MSKQKEKLMDLIFDWVTNADPLIDSQSVKEKGPNRFELELDGKKLHVEVFD